LSHDTPIVNVADQAASAAPHSQCATPRLRVHRPSTVPVDWKALNREILGKLDIPAEYRALGVRFSASTPTSNGWLACHARDREDRNPSAAVHVVSGTYVDKGGEGLKLGLWEFAARFGTFRDWKDARRHYADKAGVTLPDAKRRQRPAQIARAAVANPVHPTVMTGTPPEPSADDTRPDDCAAAGTVPLAPTGEPTAPALVLEAENQALIVLAGIVVIGEYAGQEVEVYSRPCRKVVRYDSINKLTYTTLIQLVGEPAWNFYTGKNRVEGKQPFSRLLEAIAVHAGRTDLSRTGTLGQGIWRAGGRIVIVNGGTAAAYDGGRLTRIDHPRIGNDILDFSATDPWVDFAALNAHLTSAGDFDWCRQVVSEAAALFANWNRRHPEDAGVAALLVAYSFTQTLWPWRPEVAITGPSDCGKTSLLTMLTTMFGPLNMYVSKPTEAGLRQHLANSARVILVDEFESSHHRQKILDMCRTTSQGGVVIRGTADQKGRAFRICHIPWFAAIESGLTEAADRNRFIILDLAALPPTRRGRLLLPGDSALRELGLKLCAVALRHAEQVTKTFRVLKGTTFDGVHGRLVENFALPAALLAVVHEQDEDNARKTLGGLLADRGQLARQGGADEKDLLTAILGSQYHIGGGVTTSVSATLADRDAFARHWETLETVGVGLTAANAPGGRRPADWCAKWWAEGKLTDIFLDTDKVRRFLLKGTRWEGLDIEQLLLRVPGAKREKRTACRVRVWGLVIPKKQTDLDDGSKPDEGK
jgi:hypothetical protein